MPGTQSGRVALTLSSYNSFLIPSLFLLLSTFLSLPRLLLPTLPYLCGTLLKRPNAQKILGFFELTHTRFPQGQYPAVWELPQPCKGGEHEGTDIDTSDGDLADSSEEDEEESKVPEVPMEQVKGAASNIRDASGSTPTTTKPATHSSRSHPAPPPKSTTSSHKPVCALVLRRVSSTSSLPQHTKPSPPLQPLKLKASQLGLSPQILETCSAPPSCGEPSSTSKGNPAKRQRVGRDTRDILKERKALAKHP